MLHVNNWPDRTLKIMKPIWHDSLNWPVEIACVSGVSKNHNTLIDNSCGWYFIHPWNLLPSAFQENQPVSSADTSRALIQTNHTGFCCFALCLFNWKKNLEFFCCAKWHQSEGSIHHFSIDWDISPTNDYKDGLTFSYLSHHQQVFSGYGMTAIRRTSITFFIDIQSAQIICSHDFGDPLTFPVAPPAGQSFYLSCWTSQCPPDENVCPKTTHTTNHNRFTDRLTFPHAPAWSSYLWFACLDNYRMDFKEIWFNGSCNPLVALL